MAASTTNTSRELGAVAGVAILGLDGERPTDHQPRSPAQRDRHPQGLPGGVITAVTTGTFSTQAKQFKGTPAITKIVNEVTQAAFVAFGRGLDVALSAAGAMMLVARSWLA